jgi:transcriptional regulator with GAF, ATPase, and Fis domain
LIPRSRLLAYCLAPLLYVAIASVRATGASTASLGALLLLPIVLWFAFRATEPRTVGEDLVGEGPRLAFRLALTGAATYLAARSAGPGRAGFEAAAAAAVGLAVASTLAGIARVPEGRGLLPPGPASRRLDAALAMALLATIAATVPAVAVLAPVRGAAIDPLTIDYGLVAEGGGALGLLVLSSLRFRLARRLELGVVDRGAACFALSLTALAVSVPASLIGLAPPDRVVPGAAVFAAVAAGGTLIIPDAALISRSLRTILVICVLGTPIALFTASVAAGAPKYAGTTVLTSSATLLLIGVFAQRFSARLLVEPSRWLDALGKAQESATIPEPHTALRETLGALRDRLGPSAASPVLFRLELGDQLSVDRAGYLHQSPASLPAEVLRFCEAEPEQTFRLEVARALEIRQPDVRPTLAWMQAHGFASVTTLRDEEGPIGVLAMPRGRRKAALTLEEVQAIGRLTERMSSIFALSSALDSARQRLLDAEEVARQAQADAAATREVLARQNERHAIHARRLARQAPLGRYSPAALLASQELEVAARSREPLALLTPPGVTAEAFAAAAHLQGDHRDGPFVVVDGADAREHPLADWLGEPTSPYFLAHGGTLAILDAPALPADVQRFLARMIVDPTAHSLGSNWPEALDVLLVAAVREPIEACVAEGRLVGEFAAALGDRLILLPPLAARPEDIRALALDHLARVGLAYRGAALGLADDALALLVEHPWPLNDRELELALHRAVQLARAPLVTAADLRRAGFAAPEVSAQGQSSIPPPPSGRRGSRGRRAG